MPDTKPHSLELVLSSALGCGDRRVEHAHQDRRRAGRLFQAARLQGADLSGQPAAERNPGVEGLPDSVGDRPAGRSCCRRGARRRRAQRAGRCREGRRQGGGAVLLRLCRGRRGGRAHAGEAHRVVEAERHAHSRAELPRRDEWCERRLCHVQPGRQHRHRTARQRRSRQPVRRVRRLCVFAWRASAAWA